LPVSRLFIAEKSSLAEAIALALADINGAKASKVGGCWEVGDDIVAPLSGHMYETAEPEAYGEKYRSRGIESLPIIIGHDQWKLVPTPEPKNKDPKRAYVDKKERLKKIHGYLRQASEIINAGDAEREGQLLVDELLVVAGKDPFASNVKRLWVSSYVRKDMISALKSMQPNSEKRNLYEAAVTRQRADWSHGMNNSRLYSALARQSGFDAYIRVGRVMTPTLRIVVDRDREIANFKPVDHYIPKPIFLHNLGSFMASWVMPPNHAGLDGEGRLIDKTVAQAVMMKIDGKPGRISVFKTETKYTPQPLLFSLAALQTECGRKLDMTAAEVLAVAQSLYETHKIATYPRSDSRYLPDTMLTEDAPGILKALVRTDVLSEIAKKADGSIKSAVWVPSDDDKVKGHHGIVPTAEYSPDKLASLSKQERDVFIIIARQFLAQFFPPFKYKATSVEVICENERFRASGRVVVDDGWKIVFGKESDEDDKDEDAQSLPAMAQGDPVTAKGGKLHAARTKPPSGFTDASLIDAMVNAHKFESDPMLKKELREGDGIGTEATRAATIEKLLHPKVGMFKRKGKTGIESTTFGKSVIDMLPKDLTSLGQTALWERKLGQINDGKFGRVQFLDELYKDIAARIEAAKGTKVEVKGIQTSTVKPMEGHGDTCPKCHQGVLVTREITSKKDGKKYRVLSCSMYPTCDYNKFDEPKVDPLPGHGKSCPKCHGGTLKTIEITSKKDGKKYKLLVCSTRPQCDYSEWPERSQVDPLPDNGKPCPKCGSPMQTFVVKKEGPNKGKRFLGCTNRECKTLEFPEPDLAPLPGHGRACEKCGKGTMKTKQITAKATGKTYVVLACTNYPACNNTVWPESPRDDGPKLPGDGKQCPECKKGILKTKSYKDKKDGKTKSMLSCSNYPSCRHAEWPETKDNKSGK
jgi:DNA topoisomerase III